MKRATIFIWAALMAAAFLYSDPPRAISFVSLLDETWQWDIFFGTWGIHLLAATFLAVWIGSLWVWGIPGLLIIGDLKLGSGMSHPVRIGFGFGGLGLAVFGLGLTGLLSVPLLAAVAVFPAILSFSRGCLGIKAGALDFPDPKWILAAAIAILAALPGIFSPETSWDAVVYHLRLPEFYLMEHKIFFFYDSPFAGFPSLTEMHYLLGMAVSGIERLPKLQHAALWLATAWIIYLMARPVSDRAAYGGVLAWICLPLGIHLSGMAYIDLATAFMATLCAAALWGGAAGTGLRRVVGAGIFAGLAFSTKYTGGIALIGVTACLAGGARRNPRKLAGSLLPALLLAGTWGVRNFIMGGNPVYPFFSRLFGGIATAPVEYEIANFAASSWDLSGLMQRFWSLTFKSGSGVDAAIGPLWLVIFLPALVFGQVNGLWRFFVGAFITWFVLPLNCRFLLPFIPAAYLASLPAWRDRNLSAGFLAALLFLGPLGAWRGLEAALRQFDSLPSALGLRSYDRHMGLGMLPEPEYWQGARECNRRIPSGGRLLFLGGIKSFGFKMRASFSHQTHNVLPLLRLIRKADDPIRLAIILHQHGFTHLAYLPRALEDFLVSFDPNITDREAGLLVDWMSRATHFEFRTGEFLLYSLHLPGRTRKLGRVPLLEEEAVIALRQPEKRRESRAKFQLDNMAPGSSSAAMVNGIEILIRSPLKAELALGPLKRAVESDEAGPLAWRGIGFIFRQQGKFAAALVNLKRATDLSPGDAEGWYELGGCLLAAGYPALAAEHLDAAARLAPGRPEILRALAAARTAAR